MLTRARDVLLGLAIVALMAPTAFAEKPPWAGGDRGGGGKPTAPDLYGDMVLIDRDVNGVPIPAWGIGPKDEWGWVPAPIILAPKATYADCPLWYLDETRTEVKSEELIPVGATSVYSVLKIEAYRLPFDETLGEIPAEYLVCTTEADFGRLSSARSPDEVIDHALVEMVTTLKTAIDAGGTVLLDTAGRIKVIYDSENEFGDPIVVEKTIDAPLENLAGFERVLETASISHDSVGDYTGEVPAFPGGHGDSAVDLLDRAAAMLGAAGDKAGYIGLDEVVYLTQIRAITAGMNQDAKDAYGVFKDNPGYFNFGKFEYNRSQTYAGDVCYLKITDPDPVPAPGEGQSLPFTVTGVIVKEPILPLVFPALEDETHYVGGFQYGETVGGEGFTNFVGNGLNNYGNVWAFARAADDARAVINWMHDHPVPLELASYCSLEME